MKCPNSKVDLPANNSIKCNNRRMTLSMWFAPRPFLCNGVVNTPLQQYSGCYTPRHWAFQWVKPNAWGCNWATLFLGDINMRTWPSRLGESRIWDSKMWSWVPREWLRWRGLAAIVNDRPILSSESMLHKDYNRKCSVEKMLVVNIKGFVAKTNWLTVNRQS
jgi:hypothetical protein